MKEFEVICIGCPIGCRGRVFVDEDGSVVKVEGYRCKQGREYAEKELKNPVRVFTSTVRTEGGNLVLLPVRTSSPIPKSKIVELARLTKEIRVKPPVEIGQVVAENVLGLGVNLVATSRLY